MSDFKEYDKKTLKKLQKFLVEMLKDVNYICDKYDIPYFALDGTGIGAMRHEGFIPWDDDIDLRFIEEDAYRFRECVEKEMSDKYYFVDINNSNYPITFMKMCRKDTLFIDDNAYKLGERTGIFIDIFPMIYVSEDKKVREKALNKSRLIYKLGVIAAIEKPVLVYHGLKEKIILFILKVFHMIFKLFHISFKKIFKYAEKVGRTADGKTNVIASLNTVKKNASIYELDDIFPVVKKKFEDTYVYMPKNGDKLLREYFGDYMKLPPVEDRHNHFPYEISFNTKKNKKRG